MPRKCDGAADRARYRDQALEKCRQACRRAAVVPAALIAIRPLEPGDPSAGWEIHLLSLEGGLVDPADLFRGLRGNADGVGIVLSSGPSDPLDLCGLDIDDPALIPLLRPLGTYTEHTPTEGKGGARALFWGKLPEGCACRAPGAEAYESGRYFTVTGRRIDGSPPSLARPDRDTLAAVLRSLGLPGPWTTSFSPPLRGSGLKGEAG